MSKLKLKMRNGRYVIESRKMKGKGKGWALNDRINEIFDTKYGKCKIIKYVNSNEIYVKFINIGFERSARIDQLEADLVKDYLCPIVWNVGYLGEDSRNIKDNHPKLYKKINKIWRGMLHRCYDTKKDNYHNYGGSGIRVIERWHNFSNFFYDFLLLDGYDEDIFLEGKLTLDKDKFQCNIHISEKIYSPKTCCLLTCKQQFEYVDYTKRNINRIKKFIVIHPSGEQTIEKNMSEFAKIHNLSISYISICLSGKGKSHKGYKFKPYIEKCND